jgi:hypothetical protein
MPAITLSKVGSHRSDCEDIVTSDSPVPACTAVGSVVDIADSFVTQDFVAFSLMESMINVGTISPKLIAKIIRIASEPSASVGSRRSHVRGEV